jgi:hypothetical protein
MVNGLIPLLFHSRNYTQLFMSLCIEMFETILYLIIRCKFVKSNVSSSLFLDFRLAVTVSALDKLSFTWQH